MTGELSRQDMLITDIVGQMRHNIERMEREGTTGAPPLDQNSPQNRNKTQYKIDHEILNKAISDQEELRASHPEVFMPEGG